LGAEIPGSTEFGVFVNSPNATRAYVFRGQVAAQLANGGPPLPVVGEGHTVTVRTGEGLNPTITCDRSWPDAGVFARRLLLPLVRHSTDAVWLRDVGIGAQRHFVAVGTGEEIELPPPSGEAAAGTTYTCRRSFELDLDGLVPGTALLRGLYVAYNYVTAIRLNGKACNPQHRINPLSMKEGGNFNFRDGFVQGRNVLEFDVNNSIVSPSSAGSGIVWIRLELSGIRVPVSNKKRP
jgi:hypothetical protein